MKIDIVTILSKKSRGESLSQQEINSFIQAVRQHTIADHQIGAFLMSVFIRGMTSEETAWLTEAMIRHGSQLQWGHWILDEQERLSWRQKLVDKHSSGGVGDKVSLILAPLLAACGAIVPMISGRGLGITGGTIDKLESIPGYRSELSREEMNNLLQNVGCFIAGQSADIAPTDKVLYAMRNETGTVASVPLITASIISKKGVEDIRGLLLDVKFGRGAFMKTEEEAEVLAKSLVSVGNALNMKTQALIDRMDFPLGLCVGNALEVLESIELLHGQRQDGDLMQLTLETADQMLQMAGLATDKEQARQLAVQKLLDCSALRKFGDMLHGQGVDRGLLDKILSKDISDDDILRALGHFASHVVDIPALCQGYVSSIDALKVGEYCHSLGAGKTLPQDSIDYSAGVRILKKPGDFINLGDAWVRVYHNLPELTMHELLKIQDALEVSPTLASLPPLIAKILS